MAENELLDISGVTGKKWRDLIEDARSGQGRDVIGTRAMSAFRLTLKRFLKASEMKGVTLEALLDARDSPGVFRELFSTSGRLDCVRIFIETARAEPGSDRESFLVSFLENMMDRIEDQIVQAASGTAEGRGLNEADRIAKVIRRSISEDIRSLAHRLCDEPSWKPRKHPERASTSIDSTDRLLDVSLLGTRRP
jgi:hypothetical protein